MASITCSTLNGVRLEHTTWDMGGGEVVVGHPERETALVLLSGTLHCEIATGAEPAARTIERADPFDAAASGLFLPPGYVARCAPGDGGAEVVLADVPAPAEGGPAWLGVADREVRGRGSWEREVGTLLAPPVSAAMLLGETVARDGRWSTYPPHKHEVSDLPRESAMQEAFCFRVRPSTGFGVLLTYAATATDGRATVLADGSLAAVNQGHHTVAAAGEHDLYYLWAAAGEDRELVFRTDPVHAWLLENGR